MKKTITLEEAAAIIKAVAKENEREAERQDAEKPDSRFESLRAEFCTDEEDDLEVCGEDEADRLLVSCTAYRFHESAWDVVHSVIAESGVSAEAYDELDGGAVEYGIYFKIER